MTHHPIILTAILAALSLPAAAAEDHDHAGHDHAGHDHAKEAPAAGRDAHAAKGTSLGTASVAGVGVAVSHEAPFEAGKTVTLHLGITPASPAPKSIRLWIGTEDGKGSAKAKADIHGDHGHADVEVPDPLPEGAALWVQVDPAQGDGAKSSLPLKPAAK